VGRRLLTDIDQPQEGPMQITSVRYRELVSLRGCEHKALEATVGPGEPPEHAAGGSLSLLPFVPLKES
jgi:hypothetical protein